MSSGETQDRAGTLFVMKYAVGFCFFFLGSKSSAWVEGARAEQEGEN